MVAVYVYLIKMRKRTIDQVPEVIREQVREVLKNEK